MTRPPSSVTSVICLVQYYCVIYEQEGDRIGLVRKSSGALHYFINGIDQGVATPRSPQPVWGVVDLYGMAVQVTIVDVDGDVVSGSRLCPDNNIAIDVTLHQADSHIDRSE